MSLSTNRTPAFDLGSLIHAVLDALRDCFRFGRDLLGTIGRGFAWAVNYVGTTVLDLLDSERFWQIAKLIPLLNTIFGSARALRQLYLGKYDEALKSFLYGLGGLAAVLIPVYLGVGCLLGFLLGSTINNAFGGITNFIVDIWNDEGLRTATWDQMETKLYEMAIKVTPLLAAGYCPIRAIVYLCKGNTREAKASALDWIVGCVSIALGYVLVKWIDCSWLMGSIDELLGSATNPFVRAVLNCINSFARSGIVQGVCKGIASIFGQVVHDSKLITQAGFPYFQPKEPHFIQCLADPGFFIRNDTNNNYMREHLIGFVVRCLLSGYKDLKDATGKSTIEMAFYGGHPAVLQAVLGIPPPFVEKRGVTWMRKVQELLDSVGNGRDCCKFVLKKSSNPRTGIIETCCSAHPKYRVKLEEPPVSRPMNPRLLAQVKGLRILCIDGGGTRGLVSLEILRELEKQCKGTISEYFDIIVGTSTGGLIALLLADGNRSVQDIRELYFKLKNEVFSGRKGNLSAFNKLLNEFFAERIMMNIPTSTRVVITTSILGPNKQLSRKFFTNFHEESAGIKISQVARCTSAAPGYFPPFADSHGVLHLDGGLTCNNPVFVGLHQIRHQMENSVIVSIGTGRFENLEDATQRLHVSRSGPGVVGMAANGTLSRFIEILINQATKTDDEIVSDALLMCEQTKAYFYRLNPIPRKMLN
jgi:hypothetical protein